MGGVVGGGGGVQVSSKGGFTHTGMALDGTAATVATVATGTLAGGLGGVETIGGGVGVEILSEIA